MADGNIPEAPDRPELVRFKDGFGRRFVLTVDAEEEFDWSAPIDRHQHSIDTIPYLRKFQQFCEGFGVSPIYLVDYPIASSKLAGEVLGDALRAQRCEIGVQLHPWVNPPHEEEVTQFNSFAGNLPAELERAKFFTLRAAIEKTFGQAPQIYRAGRYGTGPNTAAILTEGGIAIDTSVRARFDYSSNGGPNYRDHPLHPYWINHIGGLMELPLSTAFCGPLRPIASWLYPRLWRAPRLRGALAHARLLDRIPLTPEGVTAAEALRGIDAAIAEDLPVLVFSFHSPSLAPGHTPYVRTAEDLDAFYDWWRQVFERLASRNVRPASVRDIIASAALA